MSWTSHVFVSGNHADVMAALEEIFAVAWTYDPTDTGRPFLNLEPTQVFAGSHSFSDDALDFPNGSPVPLATAFPTDLESYDRDKDIERQQATARRVFDGLKARARWSLVYVDDMDTVLDSYDPQRPAAHDG